MKFFIPVVASLLVGGAAHAADDATNFKWGAEMRTRWQMTENNDVNATKNTDNRFDSRNKINMTMMKGEALTGHVTLMHNAQWGTYGGATTANEAAIGQPGTNGGSIFLVQEAWGAWKANDMATIKWGRSGMHMADGAVVGGNDWGTSPWSFEGMGAMLNYDFGTIGLFGVKGAELGDKSASNLTSDAERNFYGLMADLKNLPEMLKMANIHVFQVNRDETGTTASSDEAISGMRYGLTLGGDMNNIDYKLTYAAQDLKYKLGTTESKSQGSMYDLAVGYKMPDMMNARIGVVYHSDTGDDSSTADKNEKYDTFFWNKHPNAGLMDVVGWGNLTDLEVNFSLEPMEKTTVGLIYSMFSRTTDKGDAYKNSGTAWGNAGASNTEKAIGTEMDLHATHDYGNGFKIHAIYGMFTPGAFLKKTGAGVDQTVENYNQFLVQGTLVF